MEKKKINRNKYMYKITRPISRRTQIQKERQREQKKKRQTQLHKTKGQRETVREDHKRGGKRTTYRTRNNQAKDEIRKREGDTRKKPRQCEKDTEPWEWTTEERKGRYRNGGDRLTVQERCLDGELQTGG